MADTYSYISRNAVLNEFFRFFASGSIGAITHFGILVLCIEVIKLGTVASTTVAFVIASTVSFLLQKIWAFRSRGYRFVGMQILLYLSNAILCLFINGFLMYLFVERLMIHYIISQIITSGLVAMESYFAYKYLVFKKHEV